MYFIFIYIEKNDDFQTTNYDHMREKIARRNENIGDPITSTHWVDSWSHERKMAKLVCLKSVHWASFRLAFVQFGTSRYSASDQLE